MKQHITIEQYQELSELAQFRLKQWEQDKGIDTLLSIGEMIEFLDEHGTLGIDKKDEVNESWWRVSFGERLIDDYDELCDALWEAVKETLNKVDNLEKKV